MTYTVRFAHLASAPRLRPGDAVARGDVVGRMGSTGQSTGAHLHLDCVEGRQAGPYSLGNIEAGRPRAAPRQAAHFVDRGLFGMEPVVTVGYADPKYLAARGKLHSGFDLVPADRRETSEHFDVRWNRSMAGVVTAVRYDEASYGHCLYVAFEAQ